MLHGRVDAVFDSAGVGAHGFLENYGDAEGRAIYETNVFGTPATVAGGVGSARSSPEASARSPAPAPCAPEVS